MVSLFWLVIASLWQFIQAPLWFVRHIADLIEITLRNIAVILVFGIAAFFAIFAERWYSAWKVRQSLSNNSDRGMLSTIGIVPGGRVKPEMLQDHGWQEKIGFEQYGEAGKAVRLWLANLQNSHPGHYRLAGAVLRILAHNPKLPATHVEGGHGGKSLLEHSLTVAQCALSAARTWEYKGQFSSKGVLVSALRDPLYKFRSDDPLIGIIALAHDIGKIECYLWDSGDIVGCRREHDSVSGMMLASLDETWDIPMVDAEAMIQAVSHYHKPMMLPLKDDRRPGDDRTVALMELLISADNIAGKIESGMVYEDGAGGSISSRVAEDATEADKARIWKAFLDVTSVPDAINGRSSASIGQKCEGLVYLKESGLRVAMMKALGMSGTRKLGDGRYLVTVHIMETLMDNGVLFHRYEGQEYSHHRAMFRVAFHNGKTGDHITTWPTVLIIDPMANDQLPALRALADHPSVASIERPVFSENSAVNKGAQEQPSGPAQSEPAQEAETRPEGSTAQDASQEPDVEPAQSDEGIDMPAATNEQQIEPEGEWGVETAGDEPLLSDQAVDPVMEDEPDFEPEVETGFSGYDIDEEDGGDGGMAEKLHLPNPMPTYQEVSRRRKGVPTEEFNAAIEQYVESGQDLLKDIETKPKAKKKVNKPKSDRKLYEAWQRTFDLVLSGEWPAKTYHLNGKTWIRLSDLVAFNKELNWMDEVDRANRGESFLVIQQTPKHVYVLIDDDD